MRAAVMIACDAIGRQPEGDWYRSGGTSMAAGGIARGKGGERCQRAINLIGVLDVGEIVVMFHPETLDKRCASAKPDVKVGIRPSSAKAVSRSKPRGSIVPSAYSFVPSAICAPSAVMTVSSTLVTNIVRPSGGVSAATSNP